MMWLWIVLAAMFGGFVGVVGMAMLAVGGAADDYREGYQCGRDEACEHVRAAEDKVKQSYRRELAEHRGRYKVDDRLHNLRAERRLLRQKALGEGEDV